MLIAARPNTLKIVQAVASCRVEPKLHVIRSRSPLDSPPASTLLPPHAAVFSSSVINTLNVFKPQAFLYRIPVPGYDRLTKKFTPTYLSSPRRRRNRPDNRK